MKPGILIEIPGFGKLELRSIVSDYTGTHSRGGKITREVERRLTYLSEFVDIHILTADTFGTAERELREIPASIHRLLADEQDVQKMKFVMGSKWGRNSITSILIWFVGLNMDEPVWVPTVFSKNRDRLMEGDVAQKFFDRILEQAEAANLTSDEHFSVDGTLIEAWASQKSFQPKDQPQQPPPDDPGNPTINFRGEKRSNDTHESKTDPDARLARKSGGHESKLAYCGNVMIENRNGLVVDTELVQPSGVAERDAAVQMAARIEGTERVTVAADKAYDTKDFVAVMRELKVTPHVSQNEKRPGGSAIDSRTTRHAGYAVSQRKRKRIEEVFGWMKTVGMLRKTRHRGIFKVGWVFTFAAAAYNLVRMRNLLFPPLQSV